MAQNLSLLSPAVQKLYSALHHLELFSINNDFFDNISYLDSFLTEYRNVTFVIQKSLAHTPFLEKYKQLCNSFFGSELSKWFVEKRNEVTKEAPFPLEKVIRIRIFDQHNTINIISKSFTSENDAPFETLIDSLRGFLQSINPIEIYFTAEFIYREKGSPENLFDKIIPGVHTMIDFIHELNLIVKDTSSLYNITMNKIKDMRLMRIPIYELTICDFDYNVKTKEFRQADRFMFHYYGLPRRIQYNENLFDPNNVLMKYKKGTDIIHNMFIQFSIIHLFIFRMQGAILPTLYVFYKDNTFSVDSFDSSLRTTFYRKINDIFNNITLNNDIKAVFYVAEMLSYALSVDVFLKTYEERRNTLNPQNLLAFFMIDDNLSFRTFHFNTDGLDYGQAIKDIENNNYNTKISESHFMYPIFSAFKTHKQSQ